MMRTAGYKVHAPRYKDQNADGYEWDGERVAAAAFGFANLPFEPDAPVTIKFDVEFC